MKPNKHQSQKVISRFSHSSASFLGRTFPTSMSPSPAFVFQILGEKSAEIQEGRHVSRLGDGDVRGKTSARLSDRFFKAQSWRESPLKLQPQQRRSQGKKGVMTEKGEREQEPSCCEGRGLWREVGAEWAGPKGNAHLQGEDWEKRSVT